MGKGAISLGGGGVSPDFERGILSSDEQEKLVKYCQCSYHKYGKWNPLKFLVNDEVCLRFTEIPRTEIRRYLQLIDETRTYIEYKVIILMLLGFHKDHHCILRYIGKDMLKLIISFL